MRPGEVPTPTRHIYVKARQLAPERLPEIAALLASRAGAAAELTLMKGGAGVFATFPAVSYAQARHSLPALCAPETIPSQHNMCYSWYEMRPLHSIRMT